MNYSVLSFSLAAPHATIRDVEDIAAARIYLYRERGWADHHDVLVFGRPSYDRRWASHAIQTKQENEEPTEWKYGSAGG